MLGFRHVRDVSALTLPITFSSSNIKQGEQITQAVDGSHAKGSNFYKKHFKNHSAEAQVSSC